MKKIIFFLLLLIMSAASFSQQTEPSPVLTKQDYLKKSKKQRTAAWVLLSGGLIMTVIGSDLLLEKVVDDAANDFVTFITLGTVEPTTTKQHNPVVASALFITGIAATIGGLTSFAASKKNKIKGMSLSFKNETAPQIQKSSFVYQAVPSLTLKINL